MVEADAEVGEVLLVGGAHLSDDRAFRHPAIARRDHGRRAMHIIGADEGDLMALQAQEAHEHVGLQVLDEMTDMDVPVHVGQGGSHEDAAGHDGSIATLRGSRKPCTPRPASGNLAWGAPRVLHPYVLRRLPPQPCCRLRHGGSLPVMHGRE